jgi:protein O-mannosyl-transferase
MRSSMLSSPCRLILAAAFIITIAVYWAGLSGNYVFDDFPNIVDNHGVQPAHANLASLINAALSSPASEFKRPLASLSFAANYLAGGLDPWGMKLTNLVFHLLNGLLVFLLARMLLRTSSAPEGTAAIASHPIASEQQRHADTVAALIAAGWMLLPINLTAVLYVVQRMESMANLFVLLGLLGYVSGRRRMLTMAPVHTAGRVSPAWAGFWLCATSLILPTAIGVLAKETAVMLPLYALLIEWALFRFHSSSPADLADEQLVLPSPTVLPTLHPPRVRRIDPRITALFLVVLVLPMVTGMAWLLPGLLQPERWASRDFTLGMRLLSEARIVLDYITWTLLPTPHALSFYHDNFNVSTGLLTPWTTLASIVGLAGLTALALWLRPRRPLAALGIALFLGCQMLTGTILPLELIYEHRNYFASFGLLLAIVPLLAAPSHSSVPGEPGETLPLALPRYTLLAGLMLCWAALTALTAYAWGNPLRLAEDLAARAPQSPRAQYELGRNYIIYSHYDPASPFTRLAYAPLERSAALPNSSILPEQALIFMNSRMHLPLKDAWWDSMIAKLKAHKPGVQDESSLGALTQCIRDAECNLPKQRMMESYLAALSHHDPSARLLAMYSDYAWNVQEDHALGERMIEEAVKASPDEAAYRITLIRMLAAQGRKAEANRALEQLESLNIGGRLNSSMSELRARVTGSAASSPVLITRQSGAQ